MRTIQLKLVGEHLYGQRLYTCSGNSETEYVSVSSVIGRLGTIEEWARRFIWSEKLLCIDCDDGFKYYFKPTEKVVNGFVWRSGKGYRRLNKAELKELERNELILKLCGVE